MIPGSLLGILTGILLLVNRTWGRRVGIVAQIVLILPILWFIVELIYKLSLLSQPNSLDSLRNSYNPAYRTVFHMSFHIIFLLLYILYYFFIWYLLLFKKAIFQRKLEQGVLLEKPI
ncbi:MAG: hypothetical protein V1808_00975 [Candidatus Daviesbacteria bacterium]